MQPQKLSASMAALVDEFRFQGTAAMLSGPRAVPLAGEGATGSPVVFAYIRCDYDATPGQLSGVKTHSSKGNVRTALVSLDSLDELTERDDVYLITPSLVYRPLNDVAAAKTGLASFKNTSGLSGNGVIIGVVDSGIDPSHPAFSGRIHSIWDQTITGNGWGSTNYGTVLSGPTLVVSSDTDGHGTHVAGIAAGSDPAFGGVAQDADIVIVKTDFLNTSIGDGIRYVFSVADALDRPAVVNLSLGAHHDAHDGSDDLSVLIDQESGPGRIVVAAAGNEGGDDIHAGAVIPAGQSVEIQFVIPPNSQPGSPPFVRLNGWYGQAGSCEVSVRTSSGSSTPFQPIISGSLPSRTYNFSNAVVRLTTPPSTATPNGDHQFLAELFPGPFSSLVQGGTWRLRIRNSGASDVRIDCWSVVPPGARDVLFLAPFNTNEVKIGSPGSADQAITVASYTTRNSWTDSSGASRGVGLPIDTISDFSSPGPLRNNGRKPEVAAPGAMIVSCLSGQSTPPPTNIINGGFRVNAGTSMACPFIAGVAALLLERDPNLDPASLKQLLRAHSLIPGQTAGTFDPHWGFGLIDVGSL